MEHYVSKYFPPLLHPQGCSPHLHYRLPGQVRPWLVRPKGWGEWKGAAERIGRGGGGGSERGGDEKRTKVAGRGQPRKIFFKRTVITYVRITHSILNDVVVVGCFCSSVVCSGRAAREKGVKAAAVNHSPAARPAKPTQRAHATGSQPIVPTLRPDWPGSGGSSGASWVLQRCGRWGSWGCRPAGEGKIRQGTAGTEW